MRAFVVCLLLALAIPAEAKRIDTLRPEPLPHFPLYGYVTVCDTPELVESSFYHRESNDDDDKEHVQAAIEAVNAAAGYEACALTDVGGWQVRELIVDTQLWPELIRYLVRASMKHAPHTERYFYYEEIVRTRHRWKK